MADQELLALGPDPVTAATISKAFTAPSWLKLKNAADATEAVKAAMADPVLLHECQTANAVAQRLGGPMGRDAVYVALQPCLILFGAPTFGDGREAIGAAWISIYQDALEKLPREALDYAVSEWIANGKPFFPKPTELNKLAAEKAGEARAVAWRCRQVVEAAQRARPKEISPEERAQVGENFKALMAEMDAKAAERRAALETKRPHMSRQAMAERIRASADQQNA